MSPNPKSNSCYQRAAKILAFLDSDKPELGVYTPHQIKKMVVASTDIDPLDFYESSVTNQLRLAKTWRWNGIVGRGARWTKLPPPAPDPSPLPSPPPPPPAQPELPLGDGDLDSIEGKLDRILACQKLFHQKINFLIDHFAAGQG